MTGRGFWLLAGGVLLADQIGKLAAEAWLRPLGSVSLIPGVLSLTHVHNTGIAFGMLAGGSRLLALTGVLAAAGILLLRARMRPHGLPTLVEAALSLALGGAVGNMLDRLRLGHVIDFLDVNPLFTFPVFNIADSALSVSAALLILHALLGARRVAVEPPNAAETEGTDGAGSELTC